jgi:hypothetical protein
MKCPMTKNVKYNCLEDECAWWNEWDEKCSVLSLAQEVSESAGILQHIVKDKELLPKSFWGDDDE